MTREQIVERLVNRGVLPTPQRLILAEIVFAKPQHLSAEQIIAAVRAVGARVSKATVYNTLNLFCERGLLRTVEVDPARQFYDSTSEPHHHFFNVDTGELSDIPVGAVDLRVTTDLPAGTYQDSVDVVVRVRNAPAS